MISKVRVVAGLVSASLALSLSACGGEDSGEEEAAETFDIVFVGGKTGDAAELYGNLSRAMELAIEDLNEEGGINGREVTFEQLDSKNDPAEAVTAIQGRLSESNQPELVVAGAANSGEMMSVAPVLARTGIPVSGLGGSPLMDTTETYPLVRSMSALHTNQMQSTRAKLEEAGVKKLVAITPQNAFGDGLNAAFDSIFKDSDIEIVRQQYDPEALDQTTAIQRAMDEDPDAVFFDAVGAPGPRLLDARTKVNGALDVPFYAGLGFSQVTAPVDMGAPEGLENLEFQVFRSQVTGDPLTQTDNFASFLERYAAGADGEVKTVVLSMLAYNVVRMWAEGAEQGESVEGQEMADQITAGLEVSDDFWLGVTPPTFPEGHTISTYPPENFDYIPGSSAVENGLFVTS